MAGTEAPVLVVDMDGTLTRTDTLHEALLAFASAEPWRIPALFSWLTFGKAGFKHRLADEHLADTDTLPLNEDVLALVREARAAGRRTALVSAADQRQVDALAARTGLFDEAHGTDPGTAEGRNLAGHAKAAFLTERYGEKGFDYVGDSRADLPVWEAARRAITVAAPAKLRDAARQRNADVTHLSAPAEGRARLMPYLWALRPHQWLKNILVFMPMLAAHNKDLFFEALIAFVAFSLTASSVYLINDLLDLSADRIHPRKRHRPFAAAQIPLKHGLVLAPLLVLMAILVSLLFLPALFLAVLVLYYVVTFAYSLTLKRQLIVDIWTLAGLYTIRLLAGAAACQLGLSPWMLAFSMFIFLALAAVKRQAELMDQVRQGKPVTAGRAYHTDDLPVVRSMALAAGYAAVVVLALYINSGKVSALYPVHQFLWVVCPILLYWISRMVMVTHRGQMTDDPIVFAMRDATSIVCVVLAGFATLAAWQWPAAP